MTVDELRTALKGGQSVAEVARSKGIDPERVVDALVDALRTRLDEKVAAGDVTREQADEMLARATEHIRAHVNGQGSGLWRQAPPRPGWTGGGWAPPGGPGDHPSGETAPAA
jgi:hypothetical protein